MCGTRVRVSRNTCVSAKHLEIINFASHPLSMSAVTFLPDNNTFLTSKLLSPNICFASFKESSNGGLRTSPSFARTENRFDSRLPSSSSSLWGTFG
jgi:hypothetical protein